MQIFVIALAGLAVLILAAIFSRRTGIAAPLLLLVLGIVASYLPGVPTIELEPEWILSGVLPPLLYASSVRLPVMDLRRNASMIAWLSVAMVIISAVVIGFVVNALLPSISLPLAIALGAVVSPTDAVAATAIGKRLGLPPRLMTVLEGESLFNDASALVVLRTAVAAFAGSFHFVTAAGEFLWAVVGAIAVGVLVGWVTVWVRARLGDPVLTTTVSFAVPFVAFFPAEEMHASGVVAVVVAGIVAGHRGARILSARERVTEATNWATVNFVLENAVFLVMGMQVAALVDDVHGETSLMQVLLLAAVVLLLLVLLRVVGVGVPLMVLRLRPDRLQRRGERLDAVTAKVRALEDVDADRLADFNRRLDQGRADLEFRSREPIGLRGGAVISWAGMRGVVTLAAAESIVATPNRSTVVLTAFVVAVTSLIVFGGTLPWLIRKLSFAPTSFGDQRAQMAALIETMADTVYQNLGPLTEQVVDGQQITQAEADVVMKRFAPLVAEQQFRNKLVAKPGEISKEVLNARERVFVVQRRYLDAFREALLDERSIGAYSTQTFQRAERLLDREELQMEGLPSQLH